MSPWWEAEGKLYYVEIGNVPQKMYDELQLERFDVQAGADTRPLLSAT